MADERDRERENRRNCSLFCRTAELLNQ
jgi:hypothetical protein